MKYLIIYWNILNYLNLNEKKALTNQENHKIYNEN